MSLIEISQWTGVLAAALLMFRILSTWHATGPLTKALALTLLAVGLTQVFGTTRTISNGNALDLPTVRAIFAGRLLVVALCLVWPWRE